MISDRARSREGARPFSTTRVSSRDFTGSDPGSDPGSEQGPEQGSEQGSEQGPDPSPRFAGVAPYSSVPAGDDPSSDLEQPRVRETGVGKRRLRAGEALGSHLARPLQPVERWIRRLARGGVFARGLPQV